MTSLLLERSYNGFSVRVLADKTLLSERDIVQFDDWFIFESLLFESLDDGNDVEQKYGKTFDMILCPEDDETITEYIDKFALQLLGSSGVCYVVKRV